MRRRCSGSGWPPPAAVRTTRHPPCAQKPGLLQQYCCLVCLLQPVAAALVHAPLLHLLCLLLLWRPLRRQHLPLRLQLLLCPSPSLPTAEAPPMRGPAKMPSVSALRGLSSHAAGIAPTPSPRPRLHPLPSLRHPQPSRLAACQPSRQGCTCPGAAPQIPGRAPLGPAVQRSSA